MVSYMGAIILQGPHQVVLILIVVDDGLVHDDEITLSYEDIVS